MYILHKTVWHHTTRKAVKENSLKNKAKLKQ